MDREPCQHLLLVRAHAHCTALWTTSQAQIGGCPCNIWPFLHSVVKHNLLIPQRHSENHFKKTRRQQREDIGPGKRMTRKIPEWWIEKREGGGDILISLQDWLKWGKKEWEVGVQLMCSKKVLPTSGWRHIPVWQWATQSQHSGSKRREMESKQKGWEEAPIWASDDTRPPS